MTHRPDAMDCAEFLERYSEYDDSLVAPREGERFRAHMALCTSCARYDRVLRKGRMLARQVTPVEPSPEFVPRLEARLVAVRGADPIAPRVPGRPGEAGLSQTFASVAAVLLISALLAALGHGPARVSAAGSVMPEFRAAAGLPMTVLGSAGSFGVEATGWPSRSLAPAAGFSYSPLVTGPPAYPRAVPVSTTTAPASTSRAASPLRFAHPTPD